LEKTTIANEIKTLNIVALQIKRELEKWNYNKYIVI
jgi:hypothetical protein